MNRSWILGIVAIAAVGCSKGGGAPGDTQAPTGGPGTNSTLAGTSLPEPGTVGSFAAAAAIKSATYPTRITSAGGTVYVSDAVGNQVVGTDAAGTPTVAITGLDKPLGLAVAGDAVYVGNVGRKDVEVYSLAERKYVRSLGGAGAFEMPNAIAVASDGTVFVADSKKNVVQVFSAAGTPTQTLGGTGSGNGQLNFPCAVAVDDTRIVVGDQGNHRVQMFDRKGGFMAAMGGEVTGGKCHDDYKGKFTNVAGVALSGSNVLVLDSAHAYVQVLDGAGTFKGFMGASGDCASCMKLGLDVAVAADGSVLVTDPENKRFVTLSPELR